MITRCNRIFAFTWFLTCLGVPVALGETVLVEAESFSNRGGWVIDQQSMDHMGSPFMTRRDSTDVAMQLSFLPINNSLHQIASASFRHFG